MSFKYLVGIDEVGRGPFAGPVAIGAFAIPFAWQDFGKIFRGVCDSKKLTGEGREKWLSVIKKQKEKGTINYSVSFVGPKIIDSKGLSFAIRSALKSSLKKLALKPSQCLVLLDGGLKAPEQYMFQKTIIKGDEKEKIIALASIVAKVARDKKMIRCAEKYPHYGFEKHKGYGTRLHRDAIRQFGSCEIHRHSFLSNFSS